MVREASRNTSFTSPQGWVGEIVSQVRTGGFLTFEYHVWRDHPQHGHRHHHLHRGQRRGRSK